MKIKGGLTKFGERLHKNKLEKKKEVGKDQSHIQTKKENQNQEETKVLSPP